MLPETVLAIDIGSTWCKAAYIDARGTFVAEGRAPTARIAAETRQRPGAYWDAVGDAVRRANAALPTPPAPATVGIACRGLFGICIDRCGEGFSLSIASRAALPSPYLAGAYHALDWDGDPWAYGYAVRLAGMLNGTHLTNPDEWERIHRAGSLHDYITWRLGGEWVTDPSSGPNALAWPAGMGRVSGGAIEALPDIRQYWNAAGSLTRDAAAATGLPAGTTVVTGAHDGTAASMGVGAIQPGDACLTLGTNFALRAVTETRPETNCFGYLVAPDRWAWVNSVFGVATKLDAAVATLAGGSDDLAAHHQRLGRPGDDDVTVPTLPPLPEVDVAEISLAVSRALRDGYPDRAIYLTLLRSAAAGVRGLVDQATQHGAPSHRYVATGGGSRNPRLIAELSSALASRVRVGHPEAGLLGVGMIAAIGAGWHRDLATAWSEMGQHTLDSERQFDGSP